MAHSPPKHPGPHSLTPASSQTALLTSPNNFVPRREFQRDHRIPSSFSLLTLSNSNTLKLYSFSPTVINNLRRLFNQKDLLADEREQITKNFHEFVLEGKPWSNSKSISSEKLIIDILTVILHYGYAFLSTIDYGRESDDKLAIAFSRPALPQNNIAGLPPGLPSFAAMNGSAVSLNAPPRTPFAISFASATLVRVVGAPLHSTPAILTAVRGAWPRGIEYDKKVGDATYEFKLKGYKWFQENTFPMDSLNHIIGLLTSLDKHGFTLLTSLSLSKPSRVKDLWIFTGMPDDQSPPSTPVTLTHDPKRDPFAYSIIPGPSPLSAGAEKRSSRIIPPASNSSSPRKGHTRSASEQPPSSFTSPPVAGPPYGTAPTALLGKPSPKSKLPGAFLSSKLNRSSSSGGRLSRAGTPTAEQATRPPPAQMVRSLSNPSSVGSVDMTGIGTRAMSFSPRTPDLFYVADGRAKVAEFNPFDASLKPNAQPPHAAFIKVTTPTSDRRASLDSKNPYDRTSLRPTIRRSSTIPVTLDTRQESNTSASRAQLSPPVVTKPSAGSEKFLDKETEPPLAKRPAREPPTPLQLDGLRRTPTPPLLTPGTFRDSAFSWQTGKTQQIPITWTGRDPDPSKGSSGPLNLIADINGDTHYNSLKLPLHTGVSERPGMDRTNSSSGPLPPGGWVSSSTPREGQSDVGLSQQSYNRPPPSAMRERPSQEGDPRQHRRMSQSATRHFNQANGREIPYRPAEREAERRSEATTTGVTARTTRTSGSATVSSAQPSDSIAAPKPKPAKRETTMSGWVMVSVEGAPGSGSSSTAPSRTSKSPSQSPPGSNTRPGVRHRRSNSDSGLLRPQVNRSPGPVGSGGGGSNPAAMSAAVKTIAMMDAIEANKEEHEKSHTPSGLKRIFHRGKGSESDGSGKGSTLRRKVTPDGVGKGKELERARSEEKQTLKERMKTRGSPQVVKQGATRQSFE